MWNSRYASLTLSVTNRLGIVRRFYIRCASSQAAICSNASAPLQSVWNECPEPLISYHSLSLAMASKTRCALASLPTRSSSARAMSAGTRTRRAQLVVFCFINSRRLSTGVVGCKKPCTKTRAGCGGGAPGSNRTPRTISFSPEQNSTSRMASAIWNRR